MASLSGMGYIFCRKKWMITISCLHAVSFRQEVIFLYDRIKRGGFSASLEAITHGEVAENDF